MQPLSTDNFGGSSDPALALGEYEPKLVATGTQD